MSDKKHEIVLKSWSHHCGDGCCFMYETKVIVNGEELEKDGEDKANLLETVLKKFGIDVTVTYEEEHE